MFRLDFRARGQAVKIRLGRYQPPSKGLQSAKAQQGAFTMQYLTIPEVAAILRKSVKTIQTDVTRAPQNLPLFSKIGQRILFLDTDVYDFIRSKIVNHKSNVLTNLALVPSPSNRRGRPPKVARQESVV